MDVQFVSKHRIATHGTTQLRCLQPAEALRAAGYRVSVQTIYQTRPVASEAIVLHRVIDDDYARAFIKAARARRIPLIYDTDDLLFSAAGSAYLAQGPKAAQYAGTYERFEAAMRACDHVTVSTQFLADEAARLHHETTVIKNTLSEDYLQLSAEVVKRRQKRESGHVTLAYLSGSKSHDADFAVIKDALFAVMAKLPQTRLLLVGPLEISADFDAFGDRIVRKNFRPYAEYPYLFEDIDINLIPLEVDQAFCRAKSELKFIEAGACRVVSVASPTPPHTSVICQGENGLLAGPDGWETSLIQLVEDAALRDALGQASRETVLSHYTPRESLSSWVELIGFLRSRSLPGPAVTRLDNMVNSASLNAQYWRLKLKRALSGIANR